jgi:hypothetical protein
MNTLQRIMRHTTTDITRSKPVFKLSGEELTERLSGTVMSLVRDAYANRDYITYFDANRCPDENHMIHEYADRIELVSIDKDGKAHLVKTL